MASACATTPRVRTGWAYASPERVELTIRSDCHRYARSCASGGWPLLYTFSRSRNGVECSAAPFRRSHTRPLGRIQVVTRGLDSTWVGRACWHSWKVPECRPARPVHRSAYGLHSGGICVLSLCDNPPTEPRSERGVGPGFSAVVATEVDRHHTARRRIIGKNGRRPHFPDWQRPVETRQEFWKLNCFRLRGRHLPARYPSPRSGRTTLEASGEILRRCFI